MLLRDDIPQKTLETIALLIKNCLSTILRLPKIKLSRTRREKTFLQRTYITKKEIIDKKNETENTNELTTSLTQGNASK